MSELYLISPPNINLPEFTKTLDQTLKIGGSAGAFQLRLKDTPLKDIEQACKTLLPICHEYGVPFFINDYYELARDLEIDGIHIGQTDGELKKLKQEFGNNKIIGVSCMNSKHLAMVAAETGADYISFGAFYPTKTKKNTKAADLNLLTWWTSLAKTPCAAIGGINFNNIKKILEHNPDFVCVISAIWNSTKPGENLKKFNDICRNCL